MSYLSHEPADVVRQLLVDLALGTDPDDSDAWPVYDIDEPNSPDNVITVFHTEDRLFGKYQKTGETPRHYGIQIRIRSLDYLTGKNKAAEIESAIDKNVRLTTVYLAAETGAGGSTYIVHSVNRTTGILHGGKELTATVGRHFFTLNSLVPITEK